MQLRQEEKEILSHRGDWLNDRIMDATQILLRRQSVPYISGLDTVSKAQNLSYDCCPNNLFIQIVNRTAMKLRRRFTLADVEHTRLPRKEVKIYDSPNESVSFDTQEAICNLIKYRQPPECQNMAQEDISDDPQEPTYCTACQGQQVGRGEEVSIANSASVSLCLGSTHTS